jgi:hypothetical protein
LLLTSQCRSVAPPAEAPICAAAADAPVILPLLLLVVLIPPVHIMILINGQIMLFYFGLSIIKTLSKIVSPNGSSKHSEEFIIASFLSIPIFFTDSASWIAIFPELFSSFFVVLPLMYLSEDAVLTLVSCRI